jgi:hypothetical protein
MPPTIGHGEQVTGYTTDKLQKENKALRIERQLDQPLSRQYWKSHAGKYAMPQGLPVRPVTTSKMYPSGLALQHPAGPTLLQYATGDAQCNQDNHGP